MLDGNPHGTKKGPSYLRLIVKEKKEKKETTVRITRRSVSRPSHDRHGWDSPSSPERRDERRYVIHDRGQSKSKKGNEERGAMAVEGIGRAGIDNGTAERGERQDGGASRKARKELSNFWIGKRDLARGWMRKGDWDGV